MRRRSDHGNGRGWLRFRERSYTEAMSYEDSAVYCNKDDGSAALAVS